MSRYPSPTPEPPSARSAMTAKARAAAAAKRAGAESSPATTPPAQPNRAARRHPPAKAVPGLLSTNEAAAYLGVSPNTIRKYRDLGKIRAFYIGERLVKYDPADLDRFKMEFGS